MYIQGFIIFNRGVKEIPQSFIQVTMDMRITLAIKLRLHCL